MIRIGKGGYNNELTAHKAGSRPNINNYLIPLELNRKKEKNRIEPTHNCIKIFLLSQYEQKS